MGGLQKITNFLIGSYPIRFCELAIFSSQLFFPFFLWETCQLYHLNFFFLFFSLIGIKFVFLWTYYSDCFFSLYICFCARLFVPYIWSMLFHSYNTLDSWKDFGFSSSLTDQINPACRSSNFVDWPVLSSGFLATIWVLIGFCAPCLYPIW